MAVGVSSAGTSFNQIMGSPLIAFMQSHYSPRTVLLMISVLLLQICIAASLMPSDSDHGGLQPANHLAMLRRREVVTLCFVVGITNATMSVFTGTVPLSLLSNGYSPREIVPYISMPGVTNLVARMSIGLLVSCFSRSSLVMRVCSALTAATIPGECTPTTRHCLHFYANIFSSHVKVTPPCPQRGFCASGISGG